MKHVAFNLLASWGAFAFVQTTSTLETANNIQMVALVSGVVAICYTGSLVAKTWHEIWLIRKRIREVGKLKDD